MIIPHDQLSPQALRGLIEDFVTRDGTDGGYANQSLDRDVRAVMRQLKRGEAVIVYDPHARSTSIIPKSGLPSPSP